MYVSCDYHVLLLTGYLLIRNYHSETIQGMMWSAISFSSVWSRWYYMCLRVLDQLELAFLAEFNFPESTTADRRCIKLLRSAEIAC